MHVGPIGSLRGTRDPGDTGDAGSQPRGATSADSPQPPGAGLAARLVALAPDLVAPAFAGLSFVAMVLLLLGAYRPVLVIPLGLAGAALATGLAIPVVRHDRNPIGPAVAAFGIALAFGIASAAWSGQYLDSNLDPGTYANAGLWLNHHPSINVVPRTAQFGSAIQGLQSGAPGWSLFHGHLQAQGNHLFPALIAIGGWIGGPALLLKTNAALGAAALLALFALARRFVHGWWAVFPVAIAALSQPFSAFSRSTYAEPISAVLVLGGLALLVPAVRRPSRRGVAIGSFIVGTVCLARIDSYVYAVGIATAAVVVARIERERRWSLSLAALAGWAVPAVLGLADLDLLSHGYFHDLRVQIASEFVIIAAAFAIVFVAVAFPRNTAIARALTARRLAALAAFVAGAIVVVFAALASRPLWFVQHTPESPSFGALQTLLGLKVDLTRSYGESTVSWLAWYLGWPTVALGVVGLALLARKTMSRPRPELAVPLVVILVDALVYLVRPRIVPYQVWAVRRFVPVAIPGLLIGTAFAVSVLYRRSSVRPRPDATPPRFVGSGRALAVLFAAVALAIPAVVTWPVLRGRDHVPDLVQTKMLCRAVGKDAAILLIDPPAHELGPTLAAQCGAATAWSRVGVSGAARPYRRRRRAPGAAVVRHREQSDLDRISRPPSGRADLAHHVHAVGRTDRPRPAQNRANESRVLGRTGRRRRRRGGRRPDTLIVGCGLSGGGASRGVPSALGVGLRYAFPVRRRTTYRGAPGEPPVAGEDPKGRRCVSPQCKRRGTSSRRLGSSGIRSSNWLRA